MNSFVQKHQALVMGVLSGFDRLVFRGNVRPVAYADGMKRFLDNRDVLLKDFGRYAEATTTRVKEASLALAKDAGRPVHYLLSPKEPKEELARAIAKKDGIKEGLVCVLTTNELTRCFDIHRNREAKKLELRMRPRRCLHLYHYYLHPLFGFMHIRLQSWLPFPIQIWVNGREWLARTLERKNIDYLRRDNCLPWISDVERAQHLMDKLLTTNWRRALDGMRMQAHPAHEEIFPFYYYWTVYQSEWATDVMFRDRRSLVHLYDRLVHQGITRFHCRDVLRFLGKRMPAHGGIHGKFSGEVTSDLKERPEGIRLKHCVNGNSIKIYDKQATVLRAETTINYPTVFQVYRTAEGDEGGRPSWRLMRKGVADLARRAEVSQAINDRYLDALASIEDATPIGELTRPLCRPTSWKGRRVRALHPWSPDDLDLLRAVARAEFLVTGFRNRDLRRLLSAKPSLHTAAPRSRSAAITRKIRLLRAHGLVAKRPKSHRYMLTAKGQRATSALLAAYHASAESLSHMAA